ncbi:hypothetical protein [Haloplasma contractile]|uniref:Uncharacterized protein n=1 Tax=Haloplasma contractile SSD-17B TaxID=1033810 RepID=U2DTY6_9MOLU|nr:hypothetical protein [Haloplasma contractile]ERJ11917.1 hypothetical protein HLPCO_002157 [Haloplasma contractile SSD-17B]
MEQLKNFYQDVWKIFEFLFENVYMALFIVAVLILLVEVMLMITRNTYSKLVKMIDESERIAIEKRIEEWGEMIINNVQQSCLEKKLKLTMYSFILPIFALALVAFSIYKLNMVTNLILFAVHLGAIILIVLIVLFIRKKKGKVKKHKSLIHTDEGTPEDDD